MQYLKQFDREITGEEFEEILGCVEIHGPEGVGEWNAMVTALEVSTPATHMSFMVFLDQEPPEWLEVMRRWPGGVTIHNDWKYERMMVWDAELGVYTNKWQHFMSVEVSGGKYDPGAGESGPFTFWMRAKPGRSIYSDKIGRGEDENNCGVGWKAGENHQHPNAYVSLVQGSDPEPPEPPPCGCNCKAIEAEIQCAKEHIMDADSHLDEAMKLMDECDCTCG